MIIDIHGHLGDIFYPGGGALINSESAPTDPGADIMSFSENNLWRTDPVSHWVVCTFFGKSIIEAIHRRNKIGSLKNLSASLDSSGVDLCAALPVSPFVNFSEIAAAAAREKRIIPFTSINPEEGRDISADIASDIKNGARGLKLHPIMQSEPLDSPKTKEAVEAFRPSGFPVLFHCGRQDYYPHDDRYREHSPELGTPAAAVELVRAFPDVPIIAGHAGLFQVGELIELLGPFKNLYVDISFQSPGNIRRLIRKLGPERMLLGSDWPYSRRETAIRAVEIACKKDPAARDLILGQNAAGLLQLG